MDSKTIMTGLFGYPVAHSMSPVMHNEAFAHLHINFAYAAFAISPDRLREAVEGIRALGFRGVNVTIPHKVAVMEHLDEIDEEAAQIGAVNTIVNENGKLIGYNTDGQGYVKSLTEELGMIISGKKAAILGAGGAAKAVAVSLARGGVEKILIVNRTLAKARLLAEQLAPYVHSEAAGYEELAESLRNIDLLINTTSVGMHPNVEDMPIQEEFLHSGMIVSDLIYNPLETRLLQAAQQRGATIHNGVGMFIYQGALAFERWTGQEAPVRLMRETVLRHLQKK